MMTKTSTQRHICEHIKKHAKMQTSKEKTNKMAQSKHSKHKGSKACYHIEGKGTHVIRHIERLT